MWKLNGVDWALTYKGFNNALIVKEIMKKIFVELEILLGTSSCHWTTFLGYTADFPCWTTAAVEFYY